MESAPRSVETLAGMTGKLVPGVKHAGTATGGGKAHGGEGPGPGKGGDWRGTRTRPGEDEERPELVRPWETHWSVAGHPIFPRARTGEEADW